MTRSNLRQLRRIKFNVQPTEHCRVFAYTSSGPREITERGVIETPYLCVYRDKASFRYNRPSPVPYTSLSIYTSDWGASPVFGSLDAAMHRLLERKNIPELNPIRTNLHHDNYDISPCDVVMKRPGISFIS